MCVTISSQNKTVYPWKTKASHASVDDLDPVPQQTGIRWTTKNGLSAPIPHKHQARVLQCQELCPAPGKSDLFRAYKAVSCHSSPLDFPGALRCSPATFQKKSVTLVQQSKARPPFLVSSATVALPGLPGEGEHALLHTGNQAPMQGHLRNQHFLTDRHAGVRMPHPTSALHKPCPEQVCRATPGFTGLGTRTATSWRTPAQLCCSSCPPRQTLLRCPLHR